MSAPRNVANLHQTFCGICHEPMDLQSAIPVDLLPDDPMPTYVHSHCGHAYRIIAPRLAALEEQVAAIRGFLNI